LYLFKKTAVVSVDYKPRRVSLGHRRLRFSFQINDFKDQTRRPPERLTPVLGGGGYLNHPVFRVKQFFLKNFSTRPLQNPKAFSVTEAAI
jgi:hypothetical protein